LQTVHSESLLKIKIGW